MAKVGHRLGEGLGRVLIGMMMVGLLFHNLSAQGVASEGDELREKAQTLKRDASALLEKGNKEEAKKLMHEVKELMHRAAQLDGNAKSPVKKGPEGKVVDKKAPEKKSSDDKMPDGNNLKALLGKLKQREEELREQKGSERELDEVRHQIKALLTKLEHSQSDRKSLKGPIEEHKKGHAGVGASAQELRERDVQLDMLSKKVHHLIAAAENLKAAEEHDMARGLLEKAESLEMHIQKARKQLEEETRKKRDRDEEDDEKPDHKGIERKLREEIERLREENKSLRQRLPD